MLLLIFDTTFPLITVVMELCFCTSILFPEHNQLFCLVYEHVQVAEGSLDPHLWAYRSRITLEHLRQTLQQQNMRKKCPILYTFLQEVCVCACVSTVR